MLERINHLIYSADLQSLTDAEVEFFDDIDELATNAFIIGHESSLIDAHRILYSIYLSHLSVPWQRSAINLSDPLIAGVRQTLEKSWEDAEQRKYAHLRSSLPTPDKFSQWITDYVEDHPNNTIHPIFPFLQEEATFEQLREFFLQETPLEMLFGDIMALMLPGVYGSIKSEISQNFWDEAGHAKETSVHRYLRGQIMDYLKLPQNCYVEDIGLFVREELELINTYLCSALSRPKLGQLIGALLATELMIPGRFVYQIEGWRRLGVDDSNIKYLTDHVTVDVKHAQDWLDLVVSPLISEHPHLMGDIVVGCARRLDVAASVCERLYEHVRGMTQESLGSIDEAKAFEQMTA